MLLTPATPRLALSRWPEPAGTLTAALSHHRLWEDKTPDRGVMAGGLASGEEIRLNR